MIMPAVGAVATGARYSLKVWPPERFAQLVTAFVERFHCRILLGGDQRGVRSPSRSPEKRIAPDWWLAEIFPAAVCRVGERCALFVETTAAPCILPRRWARRWSRCLVRPIPAVGTAWQPDAGDV